MRVHYYCVMDIPNHPLRVKGLEYLQQRERKDDRKEPKMEVCTCPKCGIQLYRPSGTVSLQCTCGYVFSVKVWCVCFALLLSVFEHFFECLFSRLFNHLFESRSSHLFESLNESLTKLLERNNKHTIIQIPRTEYTQGSSSSSRSSGCSPS